MLGRIDRHHKTALYRRAPLSGGAFSMSIIVSPGPLGAHNWHPMAFSPETGYVYLPVHVSALLFSR